MKTISMHVTQIDNTEEELIYYDDLSLLLMQVIKSMKIKGTVINFTDIYNSPIDHFKNILNIYSEKEDAIIVSSIEVSPLDFDPETIPTEETVKEIQDYLITKTDEMKELGFVPIESPVFEIPAMIPVIYPNKLGKEILEFIDNIKIDD